MYRTKKILLSVLNIALLMLINYSCSNAEDPEDCTYIFKDGLEDIYGVWEPKIIINNQTGDSTFYDFGEGHHGFIFESYHYGDAFELRDNNKISIYYVADGRKCKEKSFGTWSYENMTLNFILNGENLSIAVLELDENELVFEDDINFIDSKVIMRKVQ